MQYLELDKLQTYFKKLNATITRSDQALQEGFVQALVHTNNQVYDIQIDDEYNDFNIENQLGCFFLILFALEDYADSDDYLQWCNQYGLDSSNMRHLEYFKSLEHTYHFFEQKLGEVDACITPLDYQLRTGVITSLFKS